MLSFDIKKLSILALISVSLISCSGKKDEISSGNEAMGDDAGMAADEIHAKSLTNVGGKNIPDRVFFEYDSANLNTEAKEAINQQSEHIKSNNSSVVIEGHCDSRGTREYNLALGEKRASAAKTELIKSGVDKSQIRTVSYGKEKPAVMGEDESSYSQNRRAVLIIDGK